jgi:hypothetical protein
MTTATEQKYEWYLRNKEKVDEANRQAKEEKLAFVRAAKDVPCLDCGNRYPYYVMDLDHRPGTEKICNPASAHLRMGWDRLKVEIAKCDPVCANCHRIRTHQRLP